MEISMVTEIQRAAARLALIPLCEDATFAHPTQMLRRTFGDEVVKDIKRETAQAKEYNELAEGKGGAILTPEAATYWDEVQKLIRRGMAAQARGDQAAEEAISREAENLASSFESRVPDQDKPKFKHHDILNSAATWDERWSYVEHDPPLLGEAFSSSFRIEKVANHAQQTVLFALAQPPADDELIEKMRASGLLLRKLATENRGAETLRELKTIYRKFTPKETKKAINKSKAELNKAMGIKKIRTSSLKVVDDIFGFGTSAQTGNEDASESDPKH